MNNNFYRLIQGDCLKVLPKLDEESVDCAVTDPPYGIGFMGKDWDRALPPKEAFRQIYRVLKPGALAFIMSAPRQDVLWRMLSMLEDVGFELRQSSLYWVYASGFPKAYDVSKGIDRKVLREEFIAEHGRKPTKEEMKELMNERRKVIGTNLHVKGRKPRTAGKVLSAGATRSLGSDDSLTESGCEESKKWEGWKSITGLKPALECILMVNKPFSEKTIVDNVLKHGTGAINVDASRIPFLNEEDQFSSAFTKNRETSGDVAFQRGGSSLTPYIPSPRGRFPSNLLVSDNILDTKIEKSTGHFNKRASASGYEGGLKEYDRDIRYLTDIGGFSRYFSLDAWFRERFKKLPPEVQRTFPFLEVPKASKSEREDGLEGLPIQIKPSHMRTKNGRGKRSVNHGFPETKRVNVHPTVKPLALGMYLITLGCPEKGVVIDPFLGSGTYMKSAILTGRSSIGIEIVPEYSEIAYHKCFSKTLLDSYIMDYSFEVFERGNFRSMNIPSP